MKKNKFLAKVALILAVFIAFGAGSVFATRVYFREVNIHNLSRGAYLQQNLLITTRGMIDINTLFLPLNEPMLEIGIFNSTVEYGLRQTTQNLVNSHNAIAGVNGDFFGLGSAFSLPLGFEARDGGISMSNNLNANSGTQASFLLTDNGAAIRYVRPEVGLRLNGSYGFRVGELNRVSDLRFPSFLTSELFQDTVDLDARFDAFKIVVQNNIIVDIANRYRSVVVPHDGFVIIMDVPTFWANHRRFEIGGIAEMLISANIDLDSVNLAISGGNRIITNGRIDYIRGSLSTNRHPRTLLGINEANDTLILMTIDGRNHSIGATLREAAEFMLEAGAFYAVNLDGGGSTTMVAQLPGRTTNHIINTPSDGFQRAVINAIGVRRLAPLGEIVRLDLSIRENILVQNQGVPFEINGFDIYGNIARNLPLENFNIILENAVLYEGFLFPLEVGTVAVSFYERYAIEPLRGIRGFNAVPLFDNLFYEELYERTAFEYDIAFGYMGHNATDVAFSFEHLGGFSALGLDSTLVINLWTQNGSLTQADPAQWERIQWARIERDILSEQNENIVIFLDRCPRSFTHRQERDLFHNIMLNLANFRNIFVVAYGSSNQTQFIDGIRYITLDEHSILRLRIGLDAPAFAIESLEFEER